MSKYLSPKGFLLTSEYTEVLPAGTYNTATEFQNYGAEKALLIFGNVALNDFDAIEIPVGGEWYSQNPIMTAVYAKGNGKMVVVASDHEGDINA